jgi:hypothetical protein
MASAVIADYLGQGLFADRPVTPDIKPNAMSLYYANDTFQLYYWNTDTAAWDALAGVPAPATDGDILTLVAGVPTWETPVVPPAALADLTDVDLVTTPPITGDTLVYNSGTSVWEPGVSGGGGSGGTTIYPFTPPLAADFTLSNESAADLSLVDDALVGLVMSPSVPFVGGSITHGFAMLTIPAGAWTFTTHLTGFIDSTNEFNGAGLCLRDSIGGRFYSYYNRTFGSQINLSLDKLVNGTTFNSTIRNRIASIVFPWQRIIYDDVAHTYTFQYSGNGRVWRTFATEAETAWLGAAADHIGFLIGATITTDFIQLTCDYLDFGATPIVWP